MAKRRRVVPLVLGGLIVLGAGGVLLRNEWRLAQRLDALGTAADALAGDGPDPVHLVGEAVAAAPVRDPAFDVAAEALRLDRRAETYQWREERDGAGDDDLRYERVWSPVLIRSRSFRRRVEHANPQALKVEAARFRAAGVRLDGYLLDDALLDALPATRELLPDQDRPVQGFGLIFRRAGDWLYGGDPEQPAIGDVRIRFAAAPEGVISVVAAIDGDRLVPHRAPNGATVALAAYGEVPADRLLDQAARGDWRQAWAVRGFAGLAMFVGVLLASPALAARGEAAAWRGKRRLGTLVMLALGLAAATAAIGWIGARLLLLAL